MYSTKCPFLNNICKFKNKNLTLHSKPTLNEHHSLIIRCNYFLSKSSIKTFVKYNFDKL